jgi:predicted RecA/RadA family phage recombinase
MAVNEAVPYWDPADTFTAHAATDIVGKRFVSIVGARVDGNPRVSHTGAAAGKCVGVSAYNVPAGGKLTIHHQPAIVVPVTAGAAIAAGDLVKSDANGKAVPQGGAGVIQGMALDDAALGADCPIDRSVKS